MQNVSQNCAIEALRILSNISVLLVEPSSPGNVGAVARVLKNTGVQQLILVNPCEWNIPEVRSMAHGSSEILDNCKVHPDIASATKNSNLVIGMTHRDGRMREIQNDYRTVFRDALKHTQGHRLTLVFGRERDGLWTRELEYCHWLVRIPSAVPYPSFNLSHAVLLAVYELFHIVMEESLPSRQETLSRSDELANAEETEHVVQNVIDVMSMVDFKAYNDAPESFSRVLRRFLTRVPLNRRDATVIHRIFSQIKKFARHHKSS